MDGIEILNKFKKETFYEFSEAIPIFNGNIYFIFKADIIAIEADPSKSKIEMIKKYMKKNRKTKIFASHLEIEPIAYILKANDESDYQIESIDEKYYSFVEKNKNKLLKDFLENKS